MSVEKLIQEFAQIDLEGTGQELADMISRVSLKWTRATRRAYNKKKITCACGTKTRRSNLAAHKLTRNCKRWHRRAKAAKKKAEKKKKTRKLKPKSKRVWLKKVK